MHGRSPAQMFDEYTLATASRNQKLQKFGTVEGTEANVIGESVFDDLARSLSGLYGAKPYELTLVADPAINAESAGAGKVFVDAGLLPILSSRGLWAAALGHELSHDLLGHQYQTYLFLMRQQETQAALAEAQGRAASTTAAILLALAQTGNQ